MFGSTISSLTYQLNPDQQRRLVDFLKELQKEGVDQKYIYHEKDKIENIIEDIESTIRFDASRKLATEAADKCETTIPKSQWGVHETHCCEDHGCKYGDVDCPVTIGLIKQAYQMRIMQ